MISSDQMTRMMFILFVVIVVGMTAFYVISKLIKEKRNSVDMTPPKLAGMRSPTHKEAEAIKAQVMPRVVKLIIAQSLLLLPLAIIAALSAAAMYESNKLATLIFGFVSGALAIMYICALTVPLSEIRSLNNRLYSVSDCRIKEITLVKRYRPRNVAATVRHAFIADQEGSICEFGLTKEMYGLSEGAKCLVVIYDSEAKANRHNTTGRVIYKRALYIPRD